jgi:hypothetical protein
MAFPSGLLNTRKKDPHLLFAQNLDIGLKLNIRSKLIVEPRKLLLNFVTRLERKINFNVDYLEMFLKFTINLRNKKFNLNSCYIY